MKSNSPFRRAILKIALPIAGALILLVGLASPAGAYLKGVDVSSWQHAGSTNNSCGRPIDWIQVRTSGISFAYAKSTEGTSYINPCFAQDWSGIAAAGMLRGSYHYAKPALPISTAIDQARYFVSRAGTMTGAGDLPGMLDLEETGGLGAQDLSAWTRAFMGEVRLLTGKDPVLYMGAYFFPGSIAADISSRYRLWIPSYVCQRQNGTNFCDPETYGGQPVLPSGWTKWDFWQYSSVGKVPGIYANSSGGELDNVDLNNYCCDATSLQSLAGPFSGGPIGNIDVVANGIGGVTVAGWAFDADTRDPIQVHIYVGSSGVASVAGLSRPDVDAAFGGYFGPNHGFSASVQAAPGPQQVCVYGMNAGPGVNSLIGCRTIVVPPGDPIGSLDVVRVNGNAIDVAGWAIDPNTAASIPVHVYVDGTGVALTASVGRGDIAAAFPAYGAAHGFSTTIAASPGTHNVCVYGINTAGPGGNPLLGCRSVTVAGPPPPPVVGSGSPFGVIDWAATAYGLVGVTGWAIDPDTSSPLAIHVYVNGVGQAILGNSDRPDVGAAFPGSGSAHGYGYLGPRVGNGPQTVCVYAINGAGSGGNTLIGCRVL